MDADAMPQTDLESAVLDALDPEALLADLRELVAFAPVGGSAGEAAVQGWCAERLRGLGLTVHEWDVDLAAERAGAGYPGEEVSRERLVAVVGEWGGAEGDRPALVLCGHTDVVPAGDLGRWAGDPFTLRVEGDGGARVATGRGTCDMLGGVAAVLAAVRAVAASGVAMTGRLAVHLVSGEEDGGVGAHATLAAGHGGDACVIAEPTGGAVVPANAGSLTFRLGVQGRAAHGSTRSLGESALDHLGPVLAALRDLEAARNHEVPAAFAHLDLVAPISVGIVRAGEWASTVPDLLVAEGRYGVLPGEPLEQARAAFEAAVAALGEQDPWLREHPVEVGWPGGAFASGALPDGHPLLAETLAAATVAGACGLRVEGAPYGSDLRHYAAQGIPALQYGPGELVAAHAVEESVTVEELMTCARTYALLALRRCDATAP